MGNTLGNKGGVGVFLKVGSTRILIINAHLSAHQKAVKQRNADYQKIVKLMPYLLEKKESNWNIDAENNKLAIDPTQPTSQSPPLSPTLSPVLSQQPINNIVTEKVNDSNSNNNNNNNSSANTAVSVNTTNNTNNNSNTNVIVGSAPLSIISTANMAVNPVSPINNGSNNNNNNTEIGVDSELTGDASQPVQQLQLQPPNSATVTATATPTAADEDSDSDGEEEDVSSPIVAPQRLSSLSLSQYPLGKADRKSMRTLSQCADIIIFMGDLNYRIHGNRSIIDKLLQANMHEVLQGNDQLR